MRGSGTKFKVSYIRKPIAGRSFPCIGFTFFALVFAMISMVISVRNQGQGGLQAAGFAFCSLMVSVVGLAYGLLSFADKEKNYILSKIGIVISGILILFWLCLVVIGLIG